MEQPTPEQLIQMQLEAIAAIHEIDMQGPTQLMTTFGEIYCVIAQLELALRHPENYGDSAHVARTFIQRVTQNMAHYAPVIKSAMAVASNPSLDLTRAEFERAWPCG
jgi:hypothetical protein